MILRTNQQTNLPSLSLAQAYRLGDLDGDLHNDHADFVAFKNAYDIANGAGAFVAMAASRSRAIDHVFDHGGRTIFLSARNRNRRAQR